MNDVIIRRAVFQRIAGSGNDFADEFIPGLIILDALANPVVKAPHRIIGKLERRNQQQVVPFVRPVINVLFTFEQCVN